MRRTEIAWMAVFGLVIAGLALGLAGLFRLRFQVGDVYPPYSSFRADPRGTRALFESFRELPFYLTARNLQSVEQVVVGFEGTVLRLGVSGMAERAALEREVLALEDFVRQGGRLVIAFDGSEDSGSVGRAGSRWSSGSGTNAPGSRPGSGGRPIGAGAVPDGYGVRIVDVLGERWGFQWVRPSGDSSKNNREVQLAAVEAGLPEALDWSGRGVFEERDEAWRVIYATEDREETAVMERAMGRGDFVLCAGSAIFSNEALRYAPQAGFFSWIVREGGNVIFDETHLGIVEELGVATLGRRYRLQGLLVGLLGLAVLWVWRSLVPLVPRGTEGGKYEVSARLQGRDAAGGLVTLLRRYVSPSQVLAACLAEWRTSFPREAQQSGGKADRMTTVVVREQSLPSREQDAVAAYREMRRFVEGQGPARRLRTGD